MLSGALAAAVSGLVACSFNYSSGTNSIDKDLLAAQVQAQLTKELGKQAPTIVCPDNLEPKVGATTTCVMSDPRGNYDVTVTVTKLDPGAAGNYASGNAIFDTKVAGQPSP